MDNGFQMHGEDRAATLNGSLGPILIGALLNFYLNGLVSAQIRKYHLQPRNDSFSIQCLAYFIFAVSTLSGIASAIAAYNYCVTDIVVNRLDFHVYPVAYSFLPLIVLSETPVRCFFAWRIRLLTKGIWIFALILVSSLCMIVCASIALTLSIVYRNNITNESLFYYTIRVPSIVWMTFSCVGDITISFTLVWYLRKRKTGLSSTDDLLARIIRVTVQTGVLMACTSLLSILLFVGITTAEVYLVPVIVVPPLYANVLLSSLNSRMQRDNPNQRNLISRHINLDLGRTLPPIPLSRSCSMASDHCDQSIHATEEGTILPHPPQPARLTRVYSCEQREHNWKKHQHYVYFNHSRGYSSESTFAYESEEIV